MSLPYCLITYPFIFAFNIIYKTFKIGKQCVFIKKERCTAVSMDCDVFTFLAFMYMHTRYKFDLHHDFFLLTRCCIYELKCSSRSLRVKAQREGLFLLWGKWGLPQRDSHTGNPSLVLSPCVFLTIVSSELQRDFMLSFPICSWSVS